MNPFDRLKFWKVRTLTIRLRPYEASEVPSLFRAASWNTLRYWSMLLDGDDEGIARLAGLDTEIPTPEEWWRAKGAPDGHTHEHHGDEEGYVYYPCPICDLDYVGGRSFIPHSEFDEWWRRVKV